MSFKVKFWGVRGSIACPSPSHIAFGGNTSCIEVSLGGNRIILDAGTGIRNLGQWMLKKDVICLFWTDFAHGSRIGDCSWLRN